MIDQAFSVSMFILLLDLQIFESLLFLVLLQAVLFLLLVPLMPPPMVIPLLLMSTVGRDRRYHALCPFNSLLCNAFITDA